MTLPSWTTPVLLAQESVAVEGQLGYLFERLFTPTGIIAAAAVSGLLILVFIIRKPLPILGGVVMALGTSVLPKSVELNQLIGPLQSLRFLSRSIGFALLGLIVVLALPGISRGSRTRSAGLGATAFLAFQLLYTAQLALFLQEGVLKGAFGVVAIVGMYLVFAVGFGRLMQDLESAVASMQLFVWVSVAFVTANLAQIALGPSGAMMGGRLAGITGNPQMMGCISALLILVNAFVYSELPRSKPARWICLMMVGLLGVLLLATGSRTAVIAIAVGLFVMFRFQVGRLSVLGVVVVIGYVVVSLFLESPGSAAAERLASGADTRTALWLQAIGTFLESPIIGEFVFLRPGDEANGVESSLLRSLANMGLIGGIAVVAPAVIGISYGLKGLRLASQRTEFKRMVDFYLGALAAILVLNTFDGYAFGLLTFPAIFTYWILAVGNFLAEQADSEATVEAFPEGVPAGGY
jgi:hypothetical protein